MDQPAPVSFRRDVIPAFSQAGCNMGACHGTPTGKGGFRLSLRGYLPDQDFLTLSREAGGRRINPLAAETSLILRKPLGEVPHEGGLRLTRSSKTYEFLHDWIAEGAKDDPAAPAAVELEILPESRVLNAPAKTQQVVVLVHLADGTDPRRHADLLLRLVQPRDRRGRRRRLRPVQDPGRGRDHRALPQPGRQRPADPPGRGARASGRPRCPQDNVVDRAVFAKLNRMRISPSEPCTDQEFIRRVYLDAIGVLPTPAEVEAFLADPAAATAATR